jgi:hypothetical protein
VRRDGSWGDKGESVGKVGKMRTPPSTKCYKGDVGGAAYWNTNMTCAASLRRMLYSPTVDIEPFFVTEKEKKRKKNIEETYDIVLRRKIERIALEALRVESFVDESAFRASTIRNQQQKAHSSATYLLIVQITTCWVI